MKKIMSFIVLAIVSFVSFTAFADMAGDINGWADKIPSAVPAILSVIVAGAIDLACRIMKTEKPRSIAWAIVGFFKMISGIAGAITNLVTKGAEFLDKLLPQNTK